MISDRLSRSARRATSGQPLTLLLIATSILGGIALAIACSYRPIALWWVMVIGTAFNAVRFIARLSRQSRAEHPALPPAYVRLAALAARAFAWSRRVFRRGTTPTSKASLDRQHTRFLVWFTEHNLLWTTIGFGVSLLLWYRFGPTVPALVVMAALMSCALFAALGAVAGASAPMLGLCWREPCRTPDFRSLHRLVHDIGCVVVLANRRDDAARRDWAKGGRFHELFLTVDDLARAGVEPALEAVLDADDAAARRALARKERFDRALALTPVFVAGMLAALLAVPPLAGSEPLPSLWTILARSTNASATSSRAQEEQGDARDDSRAPSSQRAGGEPASSASPSGRERPDITGQAGEGSITGDAVASAQGDGGGAAGQGAGAQAGDRTGDGESGAAGSGAPRDGRSNGAGGRGGGPRGYGTSGVAPQRAESPTAVPDAPVNPGKAIEVVLPAFSQAREDGRDETPGDDPAGAKRKANAPDQARASRARRETQTAPNEPATREPVQRLPNWIIQLLQK